MRYFEVVPPDKAKGKRKARQGRGRRGRHVTAVRVHGHSKLTWIWGGEGGGGLLEHPVPLNSQNATSPRRISSRDTAEMEGYIVEKFTMFVNDFWLRKKPKKAINLSG